jgi:PAS domain S-box-containing protein
MRDYVRRLLAERYEVETVRDGEAALAAVGRQLPDLVLADVMMPGLDGFELLRALRQGERTRTIPVVLLSARAGEEARVEGMRAGADDYIVKPFNARELLARVDGHVRLARARREVEYVLRDSEARLRSLADWAPAMLWVTDPDGSCSFLSRGWYEFTGEKETRGLEFGCLDAVHPDDRAAARDAFLGASRRREPFAVDYRLRRADGEYRWVIDTGRPRLGDGGEFLGEPGKGKRVHRRPAGARRGGQRSSTSRADTLPRLESQADPRRRRQRGQRGIDVAPPEGPGARSAGSFDGPSAIRETGTFSPEIILLDIGLPRMDGFAVARRIRALEGGDEILIIAMTGYGREEDKARAREAGFDLHLTKPIRMQDVQEFLETRA